MQPNSPADAAVFSGSAKKGNAPFPEIGQIFLVILLRYVGKAFRKDRHGMAGFEEGQHRFPHAVFRGDAPTYTWDDTISPSRSPASFRPL